jgi:hypothetical protein
MTTAKVSSTKLYFNPSTGQLNATAFNSLSDASMKTNVTPINYGLDEVLQARPVDFDWIDGSGKSFGFIAQELQKLIPDAVNTNEDGISSVNYSILTAVLFKAVQELSTEVQVLKEQISKQ